METRVRLICVLGGLPCPVVQHDVFDRNGRFVARLNLIAGLNALRTIGWTVLRFTADGVRCQPEWIVAQVRAALGACVTPGTQQPPDSVLAVPHSRARETHRLAP